MHTSSLNLPAATDRVTSDNQHSLLLVEINIDIYVVGIYLVAELYLVAEVVVNPMHLYLYDVSSLIFPDNAGSAARNLTPNPSSRRRRRPPHLPSAAKASTAPHGPPPHP